MPDVANGESLADALIATGSLDSAKIIVVTGNLNRDKLVKKLEAARAIVDQLPLYITKKTDLANDPVADDFRQKGADAILFASSSAANSYAEQAGALELAPGATKPLVGSIGVQTTETLDELDYCPDFEATKPSLDALIEALLVKLGPR
jgi:uroporphyrinogen III methyltransferase/synthase